MLVSDESLLINWFKVFHIGYEEYIDILIPILVQMFYVS